MKVGTAYAFPTLRSDTIRLKQLDINKQKEETKEVKTMNRKEISNVKSLHPWRKTNSLFFKKRKF